MAAPAPSKQLEFIINRLDETAGRAGPYTEAIELGRSSPASVADLAIAVMERFPNGGTFLDAALSYLPEELWACLVRSALDKLDRTGSSDAVDSVITYASLQALPALHPELDRIFCLRPNAGNYNENWPWRESGTIGFARLRRAIEAADTTDEFRVKAWRAMIETRDLEVVAHALAVADAVKRSPWRRSLDVKAHLDQVGLYRAGGGLKRRCPEALYHIIFPEAYFAGQSRPVWKARVHPTWKIEPALQAPALTFGGDATGECSVCGGLLHRLIVLDPVPAGLGVTGLDRLELATCLSCVGYVKPRLFHRHLADGWASDLDQKRPRVPAEIPHGPLRATEVHLAETPTRWRWQDWASSSGRENLHRLGGEPSWIQSAEYPDCPECDRPMTFLFQLDSGLMEADGGEWDWGTGGIGYGFWCDRCKISGFLWQDS